MVLVGNSFDQFSSYNCLHDKLIAFHLTHCDAVLDDIVQEEQTGLVTVDQYPFAFAVLTSHTHTVSIRVGSHHDISIDFLRQLDSQSQCFGIFRIR